MPAPAMTPIIEVAVIAVAVVAIDEETYDTPPFKDSPTVTWTTEIGRVLTAVLDGVSIQVEFSRGQRVEEGFDHVLVNRIGT